MSGQFPDEESASDKFIVGLIAAAIALPFGIVVEEAFAKARSRSRLSRTAFSSVCDGPASSRLLARSGALCDKDEDLLWWGQARSRTGRSTLTFWSPNARILAQSTEPEFPEKLLGWPPRFHIVQIEQVGANDAQ